MQLRMFPDGLADADVITGGHVASYQGENDHGRIAW
jgi:hypothetical protein